MVKKPKKRYFLDYGIVIPYIALSIIGIVMVYSATAYKLISAGRNEFSGGIKQVAFFAVGLIIIYVIYHMKIDFLQNRTVVMASFIGILAMLVLTFFIGEALGGARGWIKIAGVQVQPVEFLKIIVIWYLSYVLSKRQSTISNEFIKTVLWPVGMIAAAAFLVLVQPDTGGAAIIVLLTIVMLLASGISYWYGIAITGGGIALSFIAIEFVTTVGKYFIPEYIVNRFLVFKNPFISQYDAGMQMIQSYYAMFNGGLFGRGLGNSIQKKGFLPVAESDFIFSIIIEELGLIAAVIILLMLMFLILRIISVGIKATSTFNSMVCTGIGAMMLIQTFINVGGITGLIPMTGVTFPFISQGGSSFISLSIGVGLALNIRADELRRKYQRQIEAL
ncbi:FtsW/RodA/SpoVE family cell cycle protein [Vagococcus xieshaowenii]|uniref:Probable peptidoglycan glycosyltransferase FtsW n=1 Tax=Vagococcus xieshaowenii TaxID=2562451 RepID=A0AAJ5EGE5_9ENTE|nr:FtsW/RodA/SpoVE family cell cycle protein [Vagococcus xieshaowenii]QCA28372.1 FtsW/RodA/SpoVE family cell cycle protein [Vagococcus xieshaowenii]TFZ42871.1 FtsW/RodA/SpoVE family cell cycle protein [Vagococcus xieshaowenii]